MNFYNFKLIKNKKYFNTFRIDLFLIIFFSKNILTSYSNAIMYDYNAIQKK